MNKSGHIHEEKRQFENREKLVRLLQRMDQLPHKKLLSTSQIWTWFLQFKYWKTHQLCLRKENLENYMVFPPNRRTQSRTMTTHGRTIHHKSVFVNRVTLGVRVVTSPRSDAHAASGDRERVLPDWLQPFDGRTGGRSNISNLEGNRRC